MQDLRRHMTMQLYILAAECLWCRGGTTNTLQIYLFRQRTEMTISSTEMYGKMGRGGGWVKWRVGGCDVLTAKIDKWE